MDLSSDVLRSSHVWTEDVNQTTCARTNLVPESPVILSWNRCNDESVFPLGAAQILIHESVHHLGMSSEDFADKVVDAIYRTWVLQRKVGDLGFRFDQGTGKCRNEANEVGYNNEFWGECGSFLGLDLSYQENKSNAMRGSDFSFTVGSNVRLIAIALFNSSFEGARLHDSKIQYANLSYSNLRLLQFINNDEEWSIVGSYFIHSNLSDAYIRGIISESDFSYANLKGATIEGGDMGNGYDPRHNNFSFADLRDADLSKIAFSSQDFA